MEILVAIAAAVLLFLLIAPRAAAKQRNLSQKVLASVLAAADFKTDGLLRLGGMSLFRDDRSRRWFLRKGDNDAEPEIMPFSALQGVVLLDGDRVTARIRRGHDPEGELYSSERRSIARTGECGSLYMKLHFSDRPGDLLDIPLITSPVKRSGREYREAEAQAKAALDSLAEMMRT